MSPLKPSIPQLAAAASLIGVGVYLSSKTPHADWRAGVEGDARARRLAERSGAMRVAEGGGSLMMNEASRSLSPRVSVDDSVPHRITALDALDSEEMVPRDDQASVLDSEKKVSISGLRYRLLLEAAERALHSETPWSDLSVVALAFKKAGDEESSLYWFSRAARLARDPDDQQKGSEAMREVVKSLLSARYLDQAEKLITRIPDAGIKDRAISDLIRSLAGRHQFDEARVLAKTLKDSSALGLSYRNIAEAEARHLSLDDALLTLKLITDDEVREDAFGRVASIRVGVGDEEGAMLLIGKINDPKARDVALVRLAKLQAKGVRLSIESLSALIKDPFFRDQALREMVSSEVDRHRLKSAELTAHRIKNSKQRAKAYGSLVLLQIRHRDLEGALEIARSIHLSEFRNQAFQSVAVAQVSGDGVKAARNIANLIADDELRELTYRKIASRASAVGQTRLAVETIHHMGDTSEKAMAFASVALTQANSGADRAARRLVQDAGRHLEGVSSERDLAKTVGIIAEVHAQTGDSSAAFDAAASIENSRLRDLTYQKIALHFARSKEVDLADQSAQLIVRDVTRERALDSVALALAGGVSAADAMDLVGDLDTRRQQVRFLVAVAAKS